MAIEGILIDIDGTLVVSWEPIPGAPEAVAGLRHRGIPFRLLTNTTTRSRAALAARLVEAGFGIDIDEIITAPVATAAYLTARYPGRRVFLLVKGDVADDFEAVALNADDAEVVVIGGAEEEFSYHNLNTAFNLLDEGAALVAMHRNLYWRTSEGLKLDAGAYVAALETATGTEAEVVGKPAPAFFRSALDLLGLPPERSAMVGDDIRNDILAAQSLGMTGVLVRTGKFREETLAASPGRPDLVIDSIAGLGELLG